jgi:hypothetical protein
MFNSKCDRRRRKMMNNKLLAKHEADAVHEFIRSLLSVDISSTHELVFDAISALKLADRRDASSRR